MGVLCTALMIEYTKDAKRIAPEAMAFLAGVIHLFAEDTKLATLNNLVPSLESTISSKHVGNLRQHVINFNTSKQKNLPQLSVEKDIIEGDESYFVTGILFSSLRLIEVCALAYRNSLNCAEADAFYQIKQSLLLLKPESETSPFPPTFHIYTSNVAKILSETCKYNQNL